MSEAHQSLNMRESRPIDWTDALVAKLQHRVCHVLVARQLLSWGAGWGFLWGVAILAGRVAGNSVWPLIGGATGLPIVLAAAAWRGQRNKPEVWAVRAKLDAYNRCGGLMMMAFADKTGQWRQRLDCCASDLPTLHWHSGRYWAVAALACSFVLMAAIMPVTAGSYDVRHPLNVNGLAARLKKQITVLQRDKIIRYNAAERLRRELAQTQAEAQGNHPGPTWEQLDHLAAQMRAAAKQAASAAIQHAGQLAAAQSLSQALARDRQQLSSQQLTQAMAGLAKMTQQALSASDTTNPQLLSKTLQAALESDQFTQAQLQAMGRTLGQMNGSLSQEMSYLAQAGLISPQLLAECQQAGAADSNGLAAFLASHAGEMGISNAVRMFLAGTSMMAESPNSGGQRGGGPAAMLFNNQPASAKGINFAPKKLPPGAVASLKSSLLLGVYAATPTTNKMARASTGNALGNSKAGGGSAIHEHVWPQYQATVRRYFNR